MAWPRRFRSWSNIVRSKFDNGLNGADAVTVSPDGKHVYAAGAGGDAVDDTVAVFGQRILLHLPLAVRDDR
jgi:DNA-binding beta-propeller fold protein YncE